jgi:hypothetical protein
MNSIIATQSKIRRDLKNTSTTGVTRGRRIAGCIQNSKHNRQTLKQKLEICWGFFLPDPAYRVHWHAAGCSSSRTPWDQATRQVGNEETARLASSEQGEVQSAIGRSEEHPFSDS